MKLDFRQRLLTTTLIVGVSALATPAFAQTTPPPANPTDTAGAANAQPETTAPQEGQTAVPSTNAQGATVKSSQDIVITGTRIPQPNLTSASPVTVLSSQEIKLQGTTRTEDLINSLPQSFAAQGSDVSNGATGTADANLRGLGPQRTLVLVNGRRMQPGDPRFPVQDLNFIPASLVKRVDVLTGGASSVYGADAVAGVVNFIMDTNFTGLRIDAQASAFWHNQHGNAEVLAANAARGFGPPHGTSVNGGAQDISGVFGTSFADGRGHVVAYATYRNQDPVLQSTRDYSFCGFTANTPANVTALGRRMNCGGSATSNIATIITATQPNTYFVGGTTPADQTLTPGFVPFNFGPYNYYQRPDERYTFGTFADYEISPGAKPYLEAMFMNDVSTAVIAPAGDFFVTANTGCDNPLLSAAQLAIVCGPGNTFVDANGITRGVAYVGRRNVEGGGRADRQEHTSWRVVAGMKGDLLRGLSYDAYYQFGTTHIVHDHENDFSVRRLNQAIDVTTDPATGLPVCRGTLNGTADAGCVPYNPWSTAPNAIGPDALNFLQLPALDRGNVDETVADANFTLEGGEYGLQTPWSDRGVGINVGAEYRKEALSFLPDAEEQAGDLAGNGGATVPVNGHFDVRELFTEVQIPIVSHSFIEEFTVTGGYRYSDYKVADNHFSTNTYKISAELAPIRDVRFRGSYNRAVRAPNVVELFAPQAVGLEGTIDPCAGPAIGGLIGGPGGLNQQQCALTGVTAAQFGSVPGNPAGQYSAFLGGNPDLTPEKSDSYTFGVVLQPRFIPGLAISADYFNIKVKNLITIVGYNTIMNQCIATGDPALCSLIKRNVNNGNLWLNVVNLADGGYIIDTTTNIGGESTKGIDINGSYAHKFGHLGSLNVSFVGTYLKNLNINPLPDVEYNCSGFYGLQCGTPNPKWRHKFRVGFTLPNGLGISGQWRYFSSVKDDTLSSDLDLCPTNTAGTACNPASTLVARPLDAKLASRSYFDLALTARIADKLNLRFGVNNLLDTDPPLAGTNASGAYGARSAPPFGNGNTFPQVYDSLGRFMFAGVTVDF